jgi:hypothetical protein
MPAFKPSQPKPVSQATTKMTDWKKSEQLVGGKGDNRPDSEFCPIQLKAGIKTEMEHTKDRAKAKEIAKDHLTENSEYYEHLEKMEEKMKDTEKSLGRANDLLKSIRETIPTREPAPVVEPEPAPETVSILSDLAKALKALAVLGLSRKARMDAAYTVGVGQGRQADSPFATEDLSGQDLSIGVPKEQLRPAHEPPVVPVRRVETPSEIAPKPCSDHTYATPDNGTAPVKPFWRR